MDQVIEYLSSQSASIESTLVVSSILTLISLLMVKRSKDKMQDGSGQPNGKKTYYIAFRERSTVATDVPRPFDYPVIASFIGFEGDDGLTYVGLTSSTDGTHFHVTAKCLSDKKTNKTASEIKSGAQTAYNNDKKAETNVWDFDPKSFGEVLSSFIDVSQVEVYCTRKTRKSSRLS